jgi:pyruvate/2-oxoglutarate dehydrogenase complex dihydrolipoamide acyltransferase (E2) component
MFFRKEILVNMNNKTLIKNQVPYTVVPFPKIRKQIIDGLRLASRKHMNHVLMEIDITKSRKDVRKYRKRSGESLSFTSFAISCIAKAVDENRYLHAYKNWRNQLILFDEVDISTMIEIDVDGNKYPLDYIIRAANRKSVRDIHTEIKEVQKQSVENQKIKTLQWFLLFPTFARDICYRITNKIPHLVKRNYGTVAFSAVGMYMKGGFWGLGTPINTLNVMLGGIKESPSIIAGQIVIRQFLCVTVSFDHDIVDGAPVIRFTKRLKQLIERGHGLDIL